jgi:hypothetical protein
MDFFQKKQGTRTRARSVELHISDALEAGVSQSLLYVCKDAHACVCVWCECGVCGLCVTKLYPIKKNQEDLDLTSAGPEEMNNAKHF